MRNKLIKYSLIALAIAGFTFCKKKFDLPPAQNQPAVSNYITIDSIKKKYIHYYLNTVPQPTSFFRFSGDVNVECTVTADEVSGNLYKQVFVEDATGGLSIKLINAGGLFVGDKIRINLNNVLLNDYGNQVQLDSVDIEKRVVKISSGNIVTPTVITTAQLQSLNGSGMYTFQSRLIQLNDVEFSPGDKGQTFADAVGKNSIDRNLLDANSNLIATVRTSGYSNFAAAKTPCGKGSIVAILGQYNSDAQLILRDYAGVKMAAGGCPLMIKSFDDFSVTSGGWSTFNVTGNINWTTGSYSGRSYAQISNYSNFTNVACESWLISPSMDISGSPNPRFSFQSAFNYSGPALQVLISTNYSGGNPTSATWTALTPTLSPGSWSWVSSGNLSLSAYKSANTRVAFKYTGTGTAGSTWEVDDIAVFGE